IVDDSFIPTDDTLRAVENDVTAPWLAPTTSVLRGRFAARGARRWRSVLEIPLDGVVRSSCGSHAPAPTPWRSSTPRVGSWRTGSGPAPPCHTSRVYPLDSAV